MRIIAGKYGGRVLNSPPNYDVRPTIDKVKEALFSKIQLKVPFSTVLDLFSGTGALGIEALSRGADKVIFVDKSKESCRITESNLIKLGEKCEVINMDYALALQSFKKIKFDIIFIDPPYDLNLGEEVIKKIASCDILNDNAIIVYEHLFKKDFTINLPPNFEVTDERKYGTVGLTYITYKI